MLIHSVQWQHFITMGGYAQYVWPAYGITFIVLLGNMILPVFKHQKIVRGFVKDSHAGNSPADASAIKHRITQVAPTTSSKLSAGLTNDCHS